MKNDYNDLKASRNYYKQANRMREGFRVKVLGVEMQKKKF
jgi:hypothetical protein